MPLTFAYFPFALPVCHAPPWSITQQFISASFNMEHHESSFSHLKQKYFYYISNRIFLKVQYYIIFVCVYVHFLCTVRIKTKFSG